MSRPAPVAEWLQRSETVPPGLHLRSLEPRDREPILRLIDAWWGRPMAGLLPQPFFHHFRDTSFVLEQDGNPVAFLVGFFSQTNASEAYVHAIAVDPRLRAQGLGRLLYQRFAAVAASAGKRQVRAITAAVNAGSLAFHRRLGFRLEPTDEEEDEDPRIALVLDLPLPRTVDLASATPQQAAAALSAPLTGTQVALELLERRHAADLAAAAASSDWSRMPMDASDAAGFERWLELMMNAGTGDPRDPRAAFAVVRRTSGMAIGSTSFHGIYPEYRRVEIGMTWYAREEWGRGANVAAKMLMLERAFDLGFCRVEFKTDSHNARSRGALAALPAHFEGVLRKHMLVRGGMRRDSAYYSVLDDEWPQVRANLERRLAKLSEEKAPDPGRH